jgi:cation transporter-like permease
MLDAKASPDRDERVRSALYRTRLLVNRTPHFSGYSRKEANRALDTLDRQLGLNQVNVPSAARSIELLMRAHSSLAFALMRDDDFVDRFAPAIRQLGLRGITDRLDEVPHSVMALAIPGPIDGRVHRDDLPSVERVDAAGGALPPLPGFGTLPSSALSATAAAGTRATTLERRRSQDVKGSGVASVVAVMVFLAVIGVTVVEGIMDGFSIWDWGVMGLAALGILVVFVAWIIAIARR